MVGDVQHRAVSLHLSEHGAGSRGSGTVLGN